MDAFKQIPVLSPEESAKAQLENVILKLNKDLNGKFLDYEGNEQIF